MEEIVELLHQWHNGRSIAQIKRSLGIDRKTIRKYITVAQGLGRYSDDVRRDYAYAMETTACVMQAVKVPLTHTTAYQESCRYQTIIAKLLTRKHIKAKQVYQILKREHSYGLSYSSFKRYMRIQYPQQQRNCIRIEVAPGEEAQVDFGSAGTMYDVISCTQRRAYAFIMTLSYSRLHYVEFVFDQGKETWVRCHMNAFSFFRGVPKRIILDNLKSGVLKPNTYDPVLNKTYAECAQHYGFIIDPAKIRMARHKGKVERKVPVIRQQFLAVYSFVNQQEANKKVVGWSTDEYGMEIHGTIKRKPYEVYQQEEQATLLPLPAEPFDIAIWKEAKVHPDHHITFENNYYSLPTRYIGTTVLVRGGLNTVRIFSEGMLVKTHYRSLGKGVRVTDETDYPSEKSAYILKTKEYYQEQASSYGPCVAELVTRLMAEQTYRNLRKIQALFRYGKQYGNEPLDKAAARCLYYEDYNTKTIRTILEQKLYEQSLETDTPVSSIHQEEPAFVRNPDYYDHTKEI